MLHDTNHQTLTLSKLQRPRAGRRLVPRPRLLEQLQSPTSLILVIAPAGYGKTTLLSAWLESCPLPSTWLSLEEQDSDLTVFASYLIAAVQTQFPTAGVETESLLNSVTSPPPSVISRGLLNDLAAIEQEFVLVLDDYHVIHDSAIHQLLSDLLRHPPQALHLVLAARYDPALPLPSLRAWGHVLELRVADLRFTLEETASFLRETMQLQVDTQDISVLESRTEGWAAGLHLAALYFRHSGARNLIEANRRGHNRYMIDYLVAEILAQLPAARQDFLLKTSILDRLYGPLCDTVTGSTTGTENSQDQLEWLQQADLFLSPFEDAPQWYRFHHLFREFLSYQLKLKYTAEEIAALHRRASAWFAHHGYLDEALHHAVEAGDMDSAVQIVAQHRHELMNQAQWQRLDRWVHLFPREVIDMEPDLLLIEVWMKIIRQRLTEISVLLDRIEALLPRLSPERGDQLQGEVETRRNALYFAAGNLPLSMSSAQRALEKLPAEWWYLRGYMRASLSGSYLMSGDLKQAYATLYATGERHQGRDYRRHLIGSACFIHWIAADLSGMVDAARQVLAENDQSDRAEIVTWAQHHMGLFHYQRNDLAAAEKYLMPLVIQPYLSNANCYLNSAVLLARIRQAQGWPEEARDIAKVILSFALETRSEVLLFGAQAFQAELALRQGRPAEASQWAEHYGSFRPIPAPYAFVPSAVLAMVLLAQNTLVSRQQARQFLTQMDDYFTAIHYTSVRIRILALQAILYSAEGDERQALAALEKSTALAESGGFLRLFVDLGPQLKPLLTKLARQSASQAYLAEILAAFGAEETLQIAVQHETASARQATIAAASAPQGSALLTNRELDVLELLAKRYTDNEIAEALVISPETVRSHVVHLGNKLGVHGRRAIVQTAKEQRLLR